MGTRVERRGEYKEASKHTFQYSCDIWNLCSNLSTIHHILMTLKLQLCDNHRILHYRHHADDLTAAVNFALLIISKEHVMSADTFITAAALSNSPQ